LNEIDFWIGTFALVIFAIIEVILFIWVFGEENAWKEINSGADFRLPKLVIRIMKYVTLTYLVVLMVFWFLQDGMNILMMKGVRAEDYPYIWFARFMMIGVAALIVFLVHIAWQRKHHIQQRVPQ